MKRNRRPRLWMSLCDAVNEPAIGDRVVIARPAPDCDVGGFWTVIGLQGRYAILRQGACTYSTTIDRLDPAADRAVSK